MNRYRFLCALLGCGMATLAAAQTGPYYIGASQTFTRNTNLLGLPDGAAAPAGFTKADTISTTALLAGVDQRISRQRVFGNASLRSNRLSNNEIYNNQGYAITGGLDWETVANISGNLKLAANRNLASFNNTEIGLVTEKNIENTRQVDATARIGMVTAWTAEASVGWRSVDYSADAYRSREFRQTNGSVGLRYRPSAVSSFGVAVRTSKGEYPGFRDLGNGSFQADAFDRQDIDFSATYVPSGITSLDARISLGKTEYDVATQRDFSGVTGLIAWVWRPTGKLRLRTQLSRDPGQDSYFLASNFSDATVDFSRITTALRLQTDYEVTAKVAVNANVGVQQKSLTRTLPAALGGNATGDERYFIAGLGATWAPLRSVQLGCNINREQRSGDAPLSSDLQANSYGCFGQFTLQL